MGVSPSKKFGDESSKIISKKDVQVNSSGPKDVAIFAGGCFWGVELVFQRVPGVIKTNVGYIGGTINNPTYEQVCSGSTLHTEAVKVEFDKMAVSYDELLSVFWDVIDPTSRNKQGNDVGTQYRSGIYCQNQEQMSEALMSRTRQQRKYDVTIVTEIVIDSNFWIAEEYHQQYLSKGGQCSSKNCLIPIKCYG